MEIGLESKFGCHIGEAGDDICPLVEPCEGVC